MTTASEPTTATWESLLAAEKQKPYFKAIIQTLLNERSQGQVIYPTQADIFNALRYTPFADTHVVIIGQDPYHGPGQAHGLCFSVQHGIKLPPSLQNIFKEIQSDCDIRPPNHGSLEAWAKQGVLLLNASLSVRAGSPQSHANIGWSEFTDKIIALLNERDKPMAFLLWGASAQRKAAHVDSSKHLILKAPHPSPLSAHRGFLGCKHFSKVNSWLKAQGEKPIDWCLTNT